MFLLLRCPVTGQVMSLHKHAGGPVAHGCAPKHLAGVSQACRDVMTLWVSNDVVLFVFCRCKGELEIRKILLESLNLQQEPRVSVSKMHHLREQWKDLFNNLTSTPGT